MGQQLGKIRQTRIIMRTSMLDKAYKAFPVGSMTDDGYPNVQDRQAFVNTLMGFMQNSAKKLADDAPPLDQVAFVLLDDGDKNKDDSKYTIVLEDETRIMNMPRTFGIILIYTPTNEAEAISMVSDERIVWSADNAQNTDHRERTLRYLGFMALMAEHTPNFDKQPEPEHEMSMEEFMSNVHGYLPESLINGPEIGSDVPTDDETQTNDLIGDMNDNVYASENHNGKTKEQENTEETDLFNDLETDFNDLDLELNL